MKINTLAIIAATSLALLPSITFAAEPSGANTQLLGTFGVTFGGDDLATVEYTNGDSTTLHAGGLILFGLGIDHQFGNQWEIQSSINYHFDRANAENGDVTFQRFPLDVLGFYRSGSHRFGGGITYHMNPEFEIDVPGAHGTVSFDDAIGGVIEYDYFFTPSISLGLRGTLIDYKSSDVEDSVNGNYVGLMLNGYFF